MSSPISSPPTPASPLPPLAAMECAPLDWQQDASGEAPHSRLFDDVYFSRHNGRAETEHVFLAHNHLTERFASWRESRPFVIGETGFGTGLNMLCAWACFDRHAPAEARLHVISTEKYPLSRHDLERALSVWPDLADRARRLIDQWPEPVSGVHRLVLDSRVILDLHYGDSAERLSRLEGRVDAWFLDGFAPSKNPDMWQPGLFEAMASKSHPGATFATFTCAGLVKRGLKAAGFRWEKVAGFGYKREMLRGSIDSPPQDNARRNAPWFIAPAQARPIGHIAVIGAGLAGASAAEALARRGIKVTLVERNAPASGASGNRQGALYIKLAAETNLQSRFYLAGLLYTHRWLQRLDPGQSLWRDCGVLQLAFNAKEARRQATFVANHPLPDSVVKAVSAEAASRLAGTTLHSGGLDYPLAGWVCPARLCEALVHTPGVTFRHADVNELAFDGQGWRLRLNDNETLRADQVVVANAHLASRFTPLSWLPLQAIRGQVSETRVLPGVASLGRVVCAGGYTPPALDDILSFGATFAPNDTQSELREEDHAANLAELDAMLPEYVQQLRDAGVELTPERMAGRVGLRAASPDKTPYAGPVADERRWREAYAALAKNAHHVPSGAPGHYHPGLWVSAAHGSRGLVSAPLCAELLASRICDEPLPMERELVDHLHPGRRLIAEIIRSS